MVDAECAALGVIADGGGLREFVHVGMNAAAVERIGGLAEGHGVLGSPVGEPEVLLLEDLSQHPASVGRAAYHHPTTSFLGVPITVRDTVCGNLYLTNSRERARLHRRRRRVGHRAR